MNKAENDFLGLLISVCGENGYVSYRKMHNIHKYTDTEKNDLINSLFSYGYIQNIDLETFRIASNGKYAYVSPKKKIALLFLKNSYGLLKFILTYVLGILSGLAIAYFSHLFGWN